MNTKLGWVNNELEDLVRQLGVALEASGLGIWQHNLRKVQTQWDEQLQSIYGVAKNPLDVVWLDSIHPDDCERADAIFQKAITDRQDYASEFRIIRPDGSVRHIRSRAKFFVDRNSDPCFIGAELDVTEDALRNELLASEREAAEQSRVEARYAADHDYLTGLLNRRAFDTALYCSGNHEADALVGLCLIDVDHFKEVNDRFGHGVGDLVLRHVASILTDVVGDKEIAVRLGGDEFAILSRAADPDRILNLAGAVHRRLSDALVVNGLDLVIECSMGTAVTPANSVESLLSSSDTALYLAKKNGRNRTEQFSMALAARLIAEKHRLADLKDAISAGRIIPYYQVQVDARSRLIVGMEALARWDHEDGIRLPNDFIPMATEHNLIDAIDDAILRQVIVDIDRWSIQGVVVPRVSVNLSAARLGDPKLADKLDAVEIPHGLLAFELVETIFLDTLNPQTEANLNLIKSRGIGVEIDDLGSGHASLLGLIQLRPERVKIDRQLVMPIMQNVAQRRLITALVDIARALQIEVVAEGVETLGHADVLRELGVDTLQGYIFNRPEPQIVVTERLLSNQASASRFSPTVGRRHQSLCLEEG